MPITTNNQHGTGQDDYLFGTDGYDNLFHGRAGDDYIAGAINDDRLYGDNGNDDVSGLDGNDYLNGGAGNDQLFGGAGADNLYGGTGNDVVVGNDSTDLLSVDHLYGGAGDDYMVNYGLGSTFMRGNSGNDMLVSTNGQMYGDSGDDQLVAYAQPTSIIDMVGGTGHNTDTINLTQQSAGSITTIHNPADTINLSIGFTDAATGLSYTFNNDLIKAVLGGEDGHLNNGDASWLGTVTQNGTDLDVDLLGNHLIFHNTDTLL